ncbi:MEKHLA domain-containing protein [Saccharopolyspora sp. WRP15-2]|uniref:MEKHLA domain-containing protein n=1 Tax=Saccharopolyspora oryzae TaxID=2997343 RepID=A0ABT4UR14_9PSEU|nr:MEKHLA domain-containing protein [Saccharopolyspora oryzae]MDA3623973.1 MEKHLA domain-containing protein [Saccharopolyspora oryzae]
MFRVRLGRDRRDAVAVVRGAGCAGDRDRLLEDARRQGFTDDYRGVRVAASGRRFWIEKTLLWNLLDADGHRCGQAALIRDWRDVT